MRLNKIASPLWRHVPISHHNQFGEIKMTLLKEWIKERKELIKMKESNNEPSKGYVTARLKTLDPAIEQLINHPKANEYH